MMHRDLRSQCHLMLSGKVMQVLNLTLCVSVKLLCGLQASQGAVEEVVSSAASVTADALDSSDELDQEEDGESETKVARKKKNKRRKGIICNLFKVGTYGNKMNTGDSKFWEYNNLTRVFTVMFACCLHRKQ